MGGGRGICKKTWQLTCDLKLFDDRASKNAVSSGTQKDDVVKQAGEMALKMYLKSQGDSQGGFAGLASKFLK